jgi:hypothetical protein
MPQNSRGWSAFNRQTALIADHPPPHKIPLTSFRTTCSKTSLNSVSSQPRCSHFRDEAVLSPPRAQSFTPQPLIGLPITGLTRRNIRAMLSGSTHVLRGLRSLPVETPFSVLRDTLFPNPDPRHRPGDSGAQTNVFQWDFLKSVASLGESERASARDGMEQPGLDLAGRCLDEKCRPGRWVR